MPPLLLPVFARVIAHAHGHARTRTPTRMHTQVQRNWMYLENIFIGSEDIRKQLPQESIMFENVHSTFSRLMKKLQIVQNCHKVGGPGALQDVGHVHVGRVPIMPGAQDACRTCTLRRAPGRCNALPLLAATRPDATHATLPWCARRPTPRVALCTAAGMGCG